MKGIFWRDPNDANDAIEVLEATEEAADKYGHLYGSDIVRLTQEHIDALNSGKMLAWNDGEYSTFVIKDNVAEDGK